ncbi:hypothetical protein ACEPAH_1409 [Sanghuangporus vaninii]
MFYSAGSVSASSGRKECVSGRRGHHHRNSAQGPPDGLVLPGRSKAYTPNAPSERVESSHTTADHTPDKCKEEELLEEEELLNKTKSIADELYTEYIVPFNKYKCFARLRAKAIGYIKAQQDVESSSHYVEEVKESVKAAQREAKGGKSSSMGTTEAGQARPTSKDMKKAKVEADLARNAAIESLHKAHLEVVKHNGNGFGVGGKNQGKSELAIDAFSRNVYLALTKSSIFFSIEVLSILNQAVGALDHLRGTYSRKDILKLKSEIEQLMKEHRQLQRQEQSNSQQGIRDLEQHHLKVKKLHEIAKEIRDQELKDSDRRIERYNLTAILDRQMTELKDLEKSLPEDKIE